MSLFIIVKQRNLSTIPVVFSYSAKTNCLPLTSSDPDDWPVGKYPAKLARYLQYRECEVCVKLSRFLGSRKELPLCFSVRLQEAKAPITFVSYDSNSSTPSIYR